MTARPPHVFAIVRRSALLLAATFASACYPPTHRAVQWRIMRSVRFDAPREVVVTGHEFTIGTTRDTIDDVIGFGGELVGRSGDTLLLHPFYLTRYDAARAEHERTFYNGLYQLPAVVLIAPADTGAISAYRLPVSRRSRAVDDALLRGPALILFVGMMYRFFTTHW